MVTFKIRFERPYLPAVCRMGAFFLLLNLSIANNLNAQKGGSVGVGFQVGDPTGLNLHFRGTKPLRLDILLAWDINDDKHDFFFVNVHGLWFKPLNTSSPQFNFYYGPGAFIGLREYRGRFDDDDEVVIGASGNFGLNMEIERFDIFLQATPRLSLIPDTDFDMGGGLGLRFFF